MSELSKKEIARIVKVALAEDDVFADITSDFTIPKDLVTAFEINTREDIIFCGKDVILEVFAQLKKSAKFRKCQFNLDYVVDDGSVVKAGKSIASGAGNVKLIFAAERIVLNFIQHLSGIATITNQFVKKLNNKKIQILDTRKTLPGLRALEKYAVVVGGGKNHRMNLSDLVLIKDNHIASFTAIFGAAGVREAIEAAIYGVKKLQKKSKNIRIEIECDNFEQVTEAVKSKPDIIMLDNMKISEIKKSAALIRQKSQKIRIEVSGGINEKNIGDFSDLDVDFISIGKLTHSARAVDIGLDVVDF